jgi:hypothetical protein
MYLFIHPTAYHLEKYRASDLRRAGRTVVGEAVREPVSRSRFCAGSFPAGRPIIRTRSNVLLFL